MSQNIPPAIVSSENDLIEYYVDDALPVETSAPLGYVERYIMARCIKDIPESTTSSIAIQRRLFRMVLRVRRYIPEARCYFLVLFPGIRIEVSLRPCFHMAGFLGELPAMQFSLIPEICYLL
jgi:hypothetical protein